jgi:hypothetical protein
VFNIFSHQGNANQNTLRFHLTPVIKKKKKVTSNADGMGKRTLIQADGNVKMSVATMEMSMEVPQKTKNRDTMILLCHFWVYTQKESKLPYSRDACSPMFTMVLFTIGLWNQSSCPSMEEWIRKMWYTYMMEYCSVLKKNKIMQEEG